MRTIRPRPNPGTWAMFAIFAGICIAIVVLQPHQVLVVLGGAALVAVIGWARIRVIRLEITESVVRARQGWYLPDKKAARSDIGAIHYFPTLISFRGADRRTVIMKIAPAYSLGQMLEVAGELAVPLYDHRRWLGLREVKTGRLVNHPAPGQPIR